MDQIITQTYDNDRTYAPLSPSLPTVQPVEKHSFNEMPAQQLGQQVIKDAPMSQQAGVPPPTKHGAESSSLGYQGRHTIYGQEA